MLVVCREADDAESLLRFLNEAVSEEAEEDEEEYNDDDALLEKICEYQRAGGGILHPLPALEARLCDAVAARSAPFLLECARDGGPSAESASAASAAFQRQLAVRTLVAGCPRGPTELQLLLCGRLLRTLLPVALRAALHSPCVAAEAAAAVVACARDGRLPAALLPDAIEGLCCSSALSCEDQAALADIALRVAASSLASRPDDLARLAAACVSAPATVRPAACGKTAAAAWYLCAGKITSVCSRAAEVVGQMFDSSQPVNETVVRECLLQTRVGTTPTTPESNARRASLGLVAVAHIGAGLDRERGVLALEKLLSGLRGDLSRLVELAFCPSLTDPRSFDLALDISRRIISTRGRFAPMLEFLSKSKVVSDSKFRAFLALLEAAQKSLLPRKSILEAISRVSASLDLDQVDSGRLAESACSCLRGFSKGPAEDVSQLVSSLSSQGQVLLSAILEELLDISRQQSPEHGAAGLCAALGCFGLSPEQRGRATRELCRAWETPSLRGGIARFLSQAIEGLVSDACSNGSAFASKLLENVAQQVLRVFQLRDEAEWTLDFRAIIQFAKETPPLLWCCCTVARCVRSGVKLSEELTQTKNAVAAIEASSQMLSSGTPNDQTIELIDSVIAEKGVALATASIAFVLASFEARCSVGDSSSSSSRVRFAARLVDLASVLMAISDESRKKKTGSAQQGTCDEVAFLPPDAAAPALSLVLFLLRGGGRPRRQGSGVVAMTSCLTSARLLRIASTWASSSVSPNDLAEVSWLALQASFAKDSASRPPPLMLQQRRIICAIPGWAESFGSLLGQDIPVLRLRASAATALAEAVTRGGVCPEQKDPASCALQLSQHLAWDVSSALPTPLAKAYIFAIDRLCRASGRKSQRAISVSLTLWSILQSHPEMDSSLSMAIAAVVVFRTWGDAQADAASSLLFHCCGEHGPDDLQTLGEESGFCGRLAVPWSTEEAGNIAVHCVRILSQLALEPSEDGRAFNIAAEWALALSASSARLPEKLCGAVIVLSGRILAVFEKQLFHDLQDLGRGEKEAGGIDEDDDEKLALALSKAVERLASEENNDAVLGMAGRVQRICEELKRVRQEQQAASRAIASKRSKKAHQHQQRRRRRVRSRNSFIDANITGVQDTFADLEDFIECSPGVTYSRQEDELTLERRATR